MVTYLMSEGGSTQNTAEQMRGCRRHKGRAGCWRISSSQLLRVLSGVFTPVWWTYVGWVGEEGTGRRAISQCLCCCSSEYGALLSSCSVWCPATPWGPEGRNKCFISALGPAQRRLQVGLLGAFLWRCSDPLKTLLVQSQWLGPSTQFRYEKGRWD